MFKRNLPWIGGAAVTMLGIGLAACSGSSSSGQMQLAVADAPVDGATAVVVEFTGVELLPNNGSPVELDFAQPKMIDLIKDSGTASAVLFDQRLADGAYTQVRLKVLADGDPSHSFITLSDGTTHGLQIPSGAQTGLKLVSGFNVPPSGVVDYTIDFDLRKAITCPNGQSACFLKPALRLVRDDSVGNIAGTVDSSLVPTGCAPGVYLYTGDVTAPEDYNSTAPSTDTNQPIASKVPLANSAGTGYDYQFTFLPPGSYTAAFTCQAASDNPDQNDSLTFNPVESGIGVTAGQTTTVNFPASTSTAP
ncbi:MAG: DUF4382 domain-containing protein [Gammaproteobacteria bacterium]|nr:DUF4382 domain-containing protein [Gammaproteobacteria bacterium]